MPNRRDLLKTAGTVSATFALKSMPWLELSAAEASAAALPAHVPNIFEAKDGDFQMARQQVHRSPKYPSAINMQVLEK